MTIYIRALLSRFTDVSQFFFEFKQRKNEFHILLPKLYYYVILIISIQFSFLFSIQLYKRA